jgi:hypothetical protein
MFQGRQDSHQIFLNVTLEPFKVSLTEAHRVGLLKGRNPVLMGFIFGEFFNVKCPGLGGGGLRVPPPLPVPTMLTPDTTVHVTVRGCGRERIMWRRHGMEKRGRRTR